MQRYVDLNTMGIVQKAFLKNKYSAYKAGDFTAEECAQMNAALLDETATGDLSTGTAELVGGVYKEKFTNFTPEESEALIRDDIRAAKDDRDEGRELPLDVVLGGVTYVFDMDEASQSNINNTLDSFSVVAEEAISLGWPSNGTIPWVLADNSQLAVTASDLLLIKNAAIRRAYQLHAQYQATKAQLEALIPVVS